MEWNNNIELEAKWNGTGKFMLQQQTKFISVTYLWGTTVPKWERQSLRRTRARFIAIHVWRTDDEEQPPFAVAFRFMLPNAALGGFISRSSATETVFLSRTLIWRHRSIFIYKCNHIWRKILNSAKTLLVCCLGVLVFGNGFFSNRNTGQHGTNPYPKDEVSKLAACFTTYFGI